MKNVLEEKVLVLNSAWQVVNLTSVEEAIKQMMVDAATGLDVANGDFRPVTWDEWLLLPVREHDMVIHTPKLQLRAPTMIVAKNYAKVPKRAPRLDNRAVAERDGKRCQYTGAYAPDGNVDHIIPRAKGGKHDWSNVVWSSREINFKKGCKLNSEAGLKLIRPPVVPRAKVPAARIKPRPDRPEWLPFLVEGLKQQ
jgi:5-methylcytosine-specific restriction endonuclease McrA